MAWEALEQLGWRCLLFDHWFLDWSAKMLRMLRPFKKCVSATSYVTYPSRNSACFSGRSRISGTRIRVTCPSRPASSLLSEADRPITFCPFPFLGAYGSRTEAAPKRPPTQQSDWEQDGRAHLLYSLPWAVLHDSVLTMFSLPRLEKACSSCLLSQSPGPTQGFPIPFVPPYSSTPRVWNNNNFQFPGLVLLCDILFTLSSFKFSFNIVHAQGCCQVFITGEFSGVKRKKRLMENSFRCSQSGQTEFLIGKNRKY